ncbi:glycosyl hydrolase 115 family protein [Parvularcula maris]|uniref:Glycosyl hydrolase 115 family protein n=1 Tax=Parvularcula maris TaxID=2965077 RepID=A0A9X2LAE5_9PROT|nr:glycosyl hydrolase 115 family protein [Parvularcula maris]MCQ8186098.1 glycosyl hydrolase 115 family protein [Parvularcula maris]
MLSIICRFILVLLLLAGGSALAQPSESCGEAVSLCVSPPEAGMPLIEGGWVIGVRTDQTEHEGVRLAASNLAEDLTQISLQDDAPDGQAKPFAIIAGSLDRSPTIRSLIESGKLDSSEVEGVWEGFMQAVVEDPLPGIERALVIAGADQRGTIFGLYDLAERAGMSPWHYWADVPPHRQGTLYAAAGSRTDAPEVRYRGIFLNDEEPALGNWARDTFGGLNASFYEKVFDLVLRLKGNYVWPAMWGKAFYDDDPASGALAERMGVVMGTSHHEPLTRAHVEWSRYGEGPWNYDQNPEKLQEFWRGGMERLGEGEALVTIGMRGDGDEAMTEGTAIPLLERIVRDQRKIIAETTGRPAAETPQVWALYKEVQDYYDEGMEVPDDVTLLFADDNWGGIRRLPEEGAERPGGYGVYYHFDYVGGPRNYKWLNVTQIERTWQQMSLAWDRGVDRLWIVNVGDLKPMELPISFFLEQAWAPSEMSRERMDGYAERWAGRMFGGEHAAEIGALLEQSVKFNARRKPELLDAETFDLASGEWDEVALAYRKLAERADTLRTDISEERLAAYDQTVWFPIQAMSNLYDLYRAVAHNRADAEAGLASANKWAEAAEKAFERDKQLTDTYHEEIAGGKWDHMMSQTHIGYTYWQQPEQQAMPELVRVQTEAGRTQAKPNERGGKPSKASSAGRLVIGERPVAISAEAITCRVGGGGAAWSVLPNLGRRGDALGLSPDHGTAIPIKDAPTLTLPLEAERSGELTVRLLFLPAFDTDGAEGLRYAVGLGGGQPKVGGFDLRPDTPLWNEAVASYALPMDTVFEVERGRHDVEIKLLSPSLVLQEVQLFTGEPSPRYLGPPLVQLTKQRDC